MEGERKKRSKEDSDWNNPQAETQQSGQTVVSGQTSVYSQDPKNGYNEQTPPSLSDEFNLILQNGAQAIVGPRKRKRVVSSE